MHAAYTCTCGSPTGCRCCSCHCLCSLTSGLHGCTECKTCTANMRSQHGFARICDNTRPVVRTEPHTTSLGECMTVHHCLDCTPKPCRAVGSSTMVAACRFAWGLDNARATLPLVWSLPSCCARTVSQQRSWQQTTTYNACTHLPRPISASTPGNMQLRAPVLSTPTCSGGHNRRLRTSTPSLQTQAASRQDQGAETAGGAASP
jgi:hypothetical protein